MKQLEGQLNIFDYLKSLETVCTFSGHTCNRKELWKVAESLDEIMCPHVCCRSCAIRMCGARCNGSEEPEKIYTLDIRGICDDAYCPHCDSGLDELNWMDCERCPECGVKVSWEPWHRKNDEDNENLFGPDWRVRFGKKVIKTKGTKDLRRV